MAKIDRVPPEQAPDLKTIRMMRYACQQKGFFKHEMILSVGWNLALRAKELCGLKLSDFNYQDQDVFIRKEISKGGYSDGYVEIIDEGFAGQVKSYMAKNGYDPSDFVINYTDDRKPYSTRQLHRIIKGIGELAGVKGSTFGIRDEANRSVL